MGTHAGPVPDRGRRRPTARRIAGAVLAVAGFAAVVVVAVTGWFAWVALAMLLAFIDGVTGAR